MHSSFDFIFRHTLTYFTLLFCYTCIESEVNNVMAQQRKTSAKAASAASKVLKDGRTSKTSKTAAGSALSQRAPKKK